MREYSVSSIKRGLACSGLETDSSSFALEKGTIIHSILSDGDDYSKVSSSYRGINRFYKQEHKFEEYENLVEDIKFTYPHLFQGDWHIEEELNTEISDSLIGDVRLSGIIDKYKIEGDVAHIIDWKTGISKADTNNNYDMLQGYFYTLLLLFRYPDLKHIIFEYIYVEQDEIVRVVTDVKENTKKNLFRYIKSWIFAVQQSEGIYRISKQCNYCMKKCECPLVDNELNLLEYEKERLDIKKIKFLKSLINSIYDERKSEILENLGDDSPAIKTMNFFYVDAEQLPDSYIRKLASSSIKINRKEAEKLIEEGYNVTTKQTKTLK